MREITTCIPNQETVVSLYAYNERGMSIEPSRIVIPSKDQSLGKILLFSRDNNGPIKNLTHQIKSYPTLVKAELG